MQRPRLTIVLTAVNLLFLLLILALAGRPAAETTPAVLRGRALELVDDRGQVRSRLTVEPSGEVVLRLLDKHGTIRVKLGAGEDGSGTGSARRGHGACCSRHRPPDGHLGETDHHQHHPQGCRWPATSDQAVMDTPWGER